ncbi:methyltransferase domain-containing protein [Streptomyces sp. NPDC047967]|uniref:class I SAM-dependent DNA methyltransferase n=1 Tax=Streptomyces sp. NPDC047967 TaxID=3154924 RepID=UPI00340EA75A
MQRSGTAVTERDESQFDGAADAYESSAFDIPVREHIEHHSIRRLCGEVNGKPVLDLGCGTGLYTRRLARWGADPVIGVDVSSGMLATARSIEDAQPLGVTYLRRDLTSPCACEPQYEHLTGNIPLILAVYVLCYARTREELTAMCRTVRTELKPGGVFIAPTLNPDYAVESPEGAYDDAYYAAYGFTLTAADSPAVNGSPVTLTMNFPEAADRKPVPALSVEAVWWSRETYAEALGEAGFTDVAWRSMEVSPDGLETYGRAFWQPYLARPHARVIVAR